MFKQEQILENEELNQQLFSEGYVTLPLLDKGEIESLGELFYQHHSDSDVQGGLYVSASQKSEKAIHEMSDSIRETFRRSMQEHVMNGQTLGGTFISKPANQNEALEPHQDWSIVDESRFRSFTIWVPLMDVDENSGCMYVLPKSHNSMRGYRHLTIPSIFGQIYSHVWKHMVPVPLKAGEAIIFDHALGHASRPNRSNKVRIAATHSLLSTNPEMRFYWNNKGTVEEYIGESDHYNTDEAKVGPGRLKKLGNLDFEITQLNVETFDTLVGETKAKTGKSPSMEKMLGWFTKRMN